MKPSETGLQSDETERNDREAGRQFAWVAAFGTLICGGVIVGLGMWSVRSVLLLVAGTGVTVLGFVRPVIAIRLVGGRFSEISQSPILKHVGEGTPLATAAAEAAVPEVRRRAQWGIAAMVTAAVLLGLIIGLSYAGMLSESAIGVLVSLVSVMLLGGLVLWYRTK